MIVLLCLIGAFSVITAWACVKAGSDSDDWMEKQCLGTGEVTEMEFEEKSADELWIEKCLVCKHAYRKIDDDDILYCRLRKKECPHLAARKEE